MDKTASIENYLNHKCTLNKLCLLNILTENEFIKKIMDKAPPENELYKQMNALIIR